jgi:3-deoxy-D-manno-octulosonate 8-phosphate phosphatase (KDO 8-P phosphatase)
MEPDFSKIRAFAFDVDGVMTDGGILADLEGQLFRTFDAKDGFGIRMARMKGYPIGVITGGRSGSIRARFTGCGIPPEDVYLGSRIKIEDFEDFCCRHGLKPEEVIFFGDDVPDIETMRAAGISICPSDAADDVKQIADVVSTRPGGRGCVREYIEKTMKLQGNWNFDQQVYKKMF